MQWKGDSGCRRQFTSEHACLLSINECWIFGIDTSFHSCNFLDILLIWRLKATSSTTCAPLCRTIRKTPNHVCWTTNSRTLSLSLSAVDRCLVSGAHFPFQSDICIKSTTKAMCRHYQKGNFKFGLLHCIKLLSSWHEARRKSQISAKNLWHCPSGSRTRLGNKPARHDFLLRK